jgi:FAD/FMN-containing dehydrogenase
MEAAVLQRRFADAVGGDRVIADPEALSAYAEDMTECEPVRPDLVVRCQTVEEVQAVVRLAADQGVPLTPAVARTNVGGLAIPAPGGAVVDLVAMDRVVELDRDHMCAVIEPGVSFAQMKELLDREAPELTLSYPLSPIYASVAANFLLDGLGNLSVLHGANGEQIAGLEAVLPTGELVRTGTAAVSGRWLTRAPLPDLTGLFLNWQGTTGIVTKLAVQLWPRPAHGRRLFLLAQDMGRSFGLIRRLARGELCRDLGGISWPAAKMLFGVERPVERVPGEPEFFVYLDIGADDPAELSRRERAVGRAVAEARRDDGLEVSASLSTEELIEIAPSFGRFADFPMTLDFLLDHPGGGLTWVGTYGPTARWEEGATRCAELMVSRGFPPLLVSRPMKRGHFGVLRMVERFDKRDPGEVERVRALNLELLEVCLDLGFVPYKTPGWAWERMSGRMDPGYLELLERVKRTLDPQGIMNPGKLGL